MWNKIPLIGWVFSAISAISLAVPFWFFWTHWGLGREYFYFIPLAFQYIPFWDCVGLFVIISILKGTLIPKAFSVSYEPKVKGK